MTTTAPRPAPSALEGPGARPLLDGVGDAVRVGVAVAVDHLPAAVGDVAGPAHRLRASGAGRAARARRAARRRDRGQPRRGPGHDRGADTANHAAGVPDAVWSGRTSR